MVELAGSLAAAVAVFLVILSAYVKNLISLPYVEFFLPQMRTVTLKKIDILKCLVAPISYSATGILSAPWKYRGTSTLNHLLLLSYHTCLQYIQLHSSVTTYISLHCLVMIQGKSRSNNCPYFKRKFNFNVKDNWNLLQNICLNYTNNKFPYFYSSKNL